MTKSLTRCAWCTADPLYVAYHDNEWGKPLHDDRLLFEFLVLEGAQAGLSWLTVLRKRDNYRKAFDRFNVRKVACYDEKKILELMSNEGIIRNRLKIEATIHNAKCIQVIRKKNGSFKSVDELKNVKGFGDKTVAKMRPELTVGGDSPVKKAGIRKENKPAKAEKEGRKNVKADEK